MHGAAAIAGILLAAGLGRRYDPSGARLKLLQPAPAGPRAGSPLAQAALANLLAAVDDVVAVVRRADDDRQRQLHRMLEAAGAQLAICDEADDGIGRSIARGVGARPDAAGWLIALADMPAVAPATIAAVRDALVDGHDAAAPVHGGRRGHPVGFGRRCREALLALRGDRGARDVLARFRPRLIDVDDPGCLLDIDTPGG